MSGCNTKEETIVKNDPFSERIYGYINHCQGLNVKERRSTSITLKESPRDNMSISRLKAHSEKGRVEERALVMTLQTICLGRPRRVAASHFGLSAADSLASYFNGTT